ncbi:hypothetical protein DKX38_025247 [Salix brachista]|uniref:Uncharacterized protein n=1 Tax=Salix brachista TaxID=2182728 RepID=A0A5N5JNH3_9ROSI|nr:hypothetical protein DKX38_025247 [Salix brachista]
MWDSSTGRVISLSSGVIGGDPQKVSTQRFYLTGENRETHSKESKREDVGLGTGICGGGAVYTFNTRLADSDTGSPAISGVWQLSDQWSIHTGSLRPLLCSHLHFLVSCWCPRVCRFIAFECWPAFHTGMGELCFSFPIS